MYWVMGSVGTVYLILFFLSGKEKMTGVPSGIFRPFYKAAAYLYRKNCVSKLPLFRSSGVECDLQKIYPGASETERREQYYVKKLALCLLVVLAGTVMAVLVSFRAHTGLTLQEGEVVIRGRPGEEEQVLLLAAYAEEMKGDFRVLVGAREASGEELQALYEEFTEKLPELILGKNTSLEQISEDLVLEERYKGYPFAVEWSSDRPDALSASGVLYTKGGSEPLRVMLTAEITSADKEWMETFDLCIAEESLGEAESEHRELEAFLVSKEQESREDEMFKLPDVWQGKKLTWQQRVEDKGFLLWIIVLFTAVGVYFMSDKDLHEKTEAKKRCMKEAYPEVVHKLALYLGAGMTVRGAFQKTAEASEQMQYACRELQAGIPEAEVYERFGKKSGLQEYVRLSTLLVQNLKKGNSALLARLREEAEKAYDEQLQSCKRLGEEATTKLLVPMIMLLAVVMIMIMIPAFSSMGA